VREKKKEITGDILKPKYNYAYGLARKKKQ
jgi:hypothetical protein